jgi:hypothetical protein
MRFWDFGYSPSYYCKHPAAFIIGFYDSLKYAYQRLMRGWDENAAFSLCDYLGHLIPQLTRELIRTNHGCPAEIIDELSSGSGETRMVKDEAVRKWLNILEEIAVGFEAVARIDEPPDWYLAERGMPSLGDFLSKKSRSSVSVAEYQSVILDWNQEQYKKFHRGMYLFHRYYFDLWD